MSLADGSFLVKGPTLPKKSGLAGEHTSTLARRIFSERDIPIFSMCICTNWFKWSSTGNEQEEGAVRENAERKPAAGFGLFHW